jgi:hypothetical protein
MFAITLTIIILGTVTIALAVDVIAVFAWVRSRWR